MAITKPLGHSQRTSMPRVCALGKLTSHQALVKDRAIMEMSQRRHFAIGMTHESSFFWVCFGVCLPSSGQK